jgi:hypothetical protein
MDIRIAFAEHLSSSQSTNTNMILTLSFKAKRPFSYSFSINEDSFENKRLDKSRDPICGIYKSYMSKTIGHYKFCIVEDVGKLVSIILESDNSWEKGEIKANF